METRFLKSEDILRFYERIAQEFELYVPLERRSSVKVKCDYGFSSPSHDYVLKRYKEVKREEIIFSEYRCIEPVRALFTRIKEEVCGYFPDSEDSSEGNKEKKERPIAICGIKNCDLFSLKIQDFVFLEGGLQDPAYKKRRESALLISGDCPSFKESCFCKAFDIEPYANEGFDFNLSPLNNGFLVDLGSERAGDIVAALKGILSPATLGQLSGRSAKRLSVTKRMEEHLKQHEIPKKETLKDIVLSGYDSEVWKEEALNCVECGGCVFICDTCHCFLLADEAGKDTFKRERLWDACLFKNFARVAGGANPLRMRYMRLRNRYLKKFDFFVDNIGYQACCGCGRCVDACPGRIDIRRILRKLNEEKHLSAH